MKTDGKIEILLSALNERYQAQRAIRERVQNVGLAVIGLLLASGGWIIQAGKHFNCTEKAVAVTGLVAAIAVLHLGFLANLQKGFRKQQQVAVRIEKSLGLYSIDAFDGVEETIYPEEWSKAGTPDGSGTFFGSTYLLLYTGAIFLLVTILIVA